MGHGRAGRRVADHSVAGGERGDVVNRAQAQRLAQAFVVSKNEGLVFLDRTACCYPELVSPEGRDGGRVKIVAGIESAVAQELIGAAVKAIGAGASYGADDAA